jgi:hypothetical protein
MQYLSDLLPGAGRSAPPLSVNLTPSRSRRARSSICPASCPSTTRALPSRASPRQRTSICWTGSSSTPWRRRRPCTSTSCSMSSAPMATHSSGYSTTCSLRAPRGTCPTPTSSYSRSSNRGATIVTLGGIKQAAEAMECTVQSRKSQS